MSTGTFLAEEALKRAKVTSVAVPNEPEQVDDTFKRLKSMMQLWLSWGIVLKVDPLLVAGSDLYEPECATNAIVDNLAVDIAPSYSVPVSPELFASAKRGLYQVKSLYQELTIPEKTISSTCPVGAGNSKGIDARTFFPKDSTIGT